MKKIITTVLFATSLAASLSLITRAGTLEPTSPPAPSMRTLDEIYNKVSFMGPPQVLSDNKTDMPAGYYNGGSLKDIDPDLVASNIRYGVTIFGISGTYTGEVFKTSRPPLDGMAFIPEGSFMMGPATNVFTESEASGPSELPQHLVHVSAFLMDRCEVTKALWDTVRAYNGGNGYTYSNEGFGRATNHPVQTVNWFDAVKWCNARSEMEGLTPAYYTDAGLTTVYKTGEIAPFVNWAATGYRLPTEAEWERAARGGAADTRFPWTDYTNKISWAKANYYGWSNLFSYDLNGGSGTLHPDFLTGVPNGTNTSPVGSFPANGFGLFDMAGNVLEWCWDWYDDTYYASSPASNPRGPDGPLTYRMRRGGSWGAYASVLRLSYRMTVADPTLSDRYSGFRSVRASAGLDFGDLPDALPGTTNGIAVHLSTLQQADYRTRLADDGPCHITRSDLAFYEPGYGVLDAEADGQPNATATGDGDDESGMFWGLIRQLITTQTTNYLDLELTYVANLPVDNRTGTNAYMYGFIDANNDGDFDDMGERQELMVPSTLSPANYNLQFTFRIRVDRPTTAFTIRAPARFRLSTQAGLGPNGLAADGEVEDYIVEINWTGGAWWSSAASPTNMSLIPSGVFVMGATTNVGHEGYPGEVPQHTVYVSAFYMDRFEVTKALWDEVYDWAVTNGYTFGSAGLGQANNHPVHTLDWYDAIAWCNARSQREGLRACYENADGSIYKNSSANSFDGSCDWSDNGYRLPTEAEWEKAARGGVAGQRFPWGNTISHSNANYFAYQVLSYDVNSTEGYHPSFIAGSYPYTSPVGYFAPNGYGLYDMAGNVWEWCWDWSSGDYYSSSPSTNPQGPSSGVTRVLRGGSWYVTANFSRVANRSSASQDFEYFSDGFRCARGL